MEPFAVRAVLDTNILVRGILRRQRSTAVAIFDAMLLERFVPVTSDYVLAEVRKTLEEPGVRKLRDLSDDQIEAMIGLLREVSEVVPGYLQNLDKVPTDMKDNAIVATAV